MGCNDRNSLFCCTQVFVNKKIEGWGKLINTCVSICVNLNSAFIVHLFIYFFSRIVEPPVLDYTTIACFFTFKAMATLRDNYIKQSSGEDYSLLADLHASKF